MIVKETKIIGGITYDHTYSDKGCHIERDGIRYADAIDPDGSCREYTETDIPVIEEEEAE